MRTYGQFCSVAKALDVVGDRWTLLIFRELLAQGPCRYTDLKDGLPGIATNLLADRLRELEQAGLIRREEAAPPVATTLFHLTEAGTELEPVVRALGEWGLRFMTGPCEQDEFRSHWFMFPVSLFAADHDPGAPPVTIELRATGRRVRERPAVLEVGGGEVVTRLGAATAPDLVLTGEPQVILGLLAGHLSLDQARAGGLEASGDIAALDRVRPPGRQPAF
jgi:DNA-binding HxlR family transcriptional regulator